MSPRDAPVIVRLGGPDGRRKLHRAFDFEREGEHATVYIDDPCPLPRPGQDCWIQVAAPHPDAGAYLARFEAAHRSVCRFADLRRLDPPGPS